MSNDLQVIGKAHGYTRNGEPDADADLEKEALEAAAGADVVLYCFGLDEVSESEGKTGNTCVCLRTSSGC